MAKNPSAYIRFIYNRVNLEKAVISAAAVSALATYAHKVPALKQGIVLLLRKCLNDSDDEVRERALFYLSLLGDTFDEEAKSESAASSAEATEEIADLRSFIFDSEQVIDIDALEQYVTEQKDALLDESEEGFNIDLSEMLIGEGPQAQAPVAKAADASASQKPRAQASAAGQPAATAGKPQESAKGLTSEQDVFVGTMGSVGVINQMTQGAKPQFMSAVTPVNESTAEYVVSTMKHIYEDKIIVQYGIKNTLEDQVLTNVTVKVDGIETDSGLTVQGVIPMADGDSIKYADQKFVYLILDRTKAVVDFPLAKIKQQLSFTITEIDVDTEEEIGSYEEDYDLDQIQLAVRDYVKADLIPTGQFKDYWEKIGGHQSGSEAQGTFQLPFKTTQEAVDGITKNFGMSICDGTNKVNAAEKAHNLLLSGQFLGKEMVLVRGIIGFNDTYGCVLKVVVRSLNAAISETVLKVME